MVHIKVTWYKKTGKWYLEEEFNLPDSLEPNDLPQYIVDHQTQLSSGWNWSDWFISVSVLYQSSVDTRFFNRLFKCGDV